MASSDRSPGIQLVRDDQEDDNPTRVLSRRDASAMSPPVDERVMGEPRSEGEMSTGADHAMGELASTTDDRPPWMVGGMGSPPIEHQGNLYDAEVADELGVTLEGDEFSLFRSVKRGKLPGLVAIVGGGIVVLSLMIGLIWVMTRPDPTSSLDIRSSPPGATVLFDGEEINGVTPLKLENITRDTEHQLELRIKGFTPWVQMVKLSEVEVLKIAVLTPIRGTLRVNSEPQGASVFLDGVYQGSTPVEIDGLDINTDVVIQARYEEQVESKNLSWDGRTEATVDFRFEREQPRRRRR